MTFAEIIATLETSAALPASRMKDCKTSMRYLAHALGHPSLEACPIEGACGDPATVAATLETYFQALAAQGRTLSAVTRRNSRHNIRVVLRLAEAHGLLKTPLPPRVLTTTRRRDFLRQQRATAPYQTTYHPQDSPRHYSLPQAQWPPDIVQGFRTYRARCGLRIRETTLKKYATDLTLYLGYLAHICGIVPTWDDCFDVAQVTEFVRWHGQRVGRPVSNAGWNFTCQIAAMAVVLKHPTPAPWLTCAMS